jgi:hypothetical protein
MCLIKNKIKNLKKKLKANNIKNIKKNKNINLFLFYFKKRVARAATIMAGLGVAENHPYKA